ncbi:MAG: SRPBCC family protein [Microbacteriaceae bacterium]|nr:SRPBCC family protein [Microbacteriaceae bacterium]
MWLALHITQSIDRPPSEVAGYAGDPRNLPAWAAGLASGIREVDGTWISDSPMGPVTVAFAPGRELGILDHDVTLPDGTTFHNPLRVLANDAGSEVVFTLYRRDGMTDAEFEADAAAIRADLERLAGILEG